MSFGITSGWTRPFVIAKRDKVFKPYVSIEVYGPRPKNGGGPVDEVEVALALGTLYRAADAAKVVDLYGYPKIRITRKSDEHGARAHLALAFIASSHDVIDGGPIHYQRACRCLGAMYEVVQNAFSEQQRLR